MVRASKNTCSNIQKSVLNKNLKFCSKERLFNKEFLKHSA
jgi:hypothetical protein